MSSENQINKSIEIVITDMDGLRLMSKITYNKIHKILLRYYANVRITKITNEIDLQELVKRCPDLVFSSLKCIQFEQEGLSTPKKIWLSEYLDAANIKYTGSSKEALELDLDKSKAKKTIQNAKLNTSLFFTAIPGTFNRSEDLPIAFPLFIKPLSQGGGKGIDANSIVHDFKSYQKKIADIYTKTNTAALVERYLNGREFTVGIIGNDYASLTVMPIEVIPVENVDKQKVRGSIEKEADTDTLLSVDDKQIHKSVSMLAENAFKALGARGFGRIDIRMDTQNVPYFLEANLVPGLRKNYGDLPRSCKINKVMTYKALILKIVDLGLTRAA